MRSRVGVLVGLVAACLVASASLALAQGTPGAQQAAQIEGFDVGHTDVGPVLGVGGLGLASFSFGGRFEKGFREAGPGVLGLGVSADYWSFSDPILGSYKLTYLPIAVTVNYHFRLDNKKLDPFVGVGLGYERVSFDGPACTVGGVNYCATTYASGVYALGHAGIRYFMQPNMALYADAGAGDAALHVGLMFKVGGGH